MKKCLRLLPILLVFAAMPLRATPTQLYSSGTVLDASFSPSRNDLSFVLPFDATLTNIAFWISDTADGGGVGFLDIQYAIYTGGPQPVGSPIAAGFGSNRSNICPCLVYNVNPTGAPENWITFGVRFDVETPVSLQGGTPYLLTLSWTLDPSGVNQHDSWAATDTGARAFALYGVPEPTSLALMVLGLAGIGYRLRKSIHPARDKRS